MANQIQTLPVIQWEPPAPPQPTVVAKAAPISQASASDNGLGIAAGLVLLLGLLCIPIVATTVPTNLSTPSTEYAK